MILASLLEWALLTWWWKCGLLQIGRPASPRHHAVAARAPGCLPLAFQLHPPCP